MTALQEKKRWKAKRTIVSAIFTCLFVWFSISTLHAQSNMTITGKVISGLTQEPLVGVSIVESGTLNGATTDLNGRYSLTLIGDNSVVEFSYVGFLSEKIEVRGRTELNVTLMESVEMLSELVVVGYGVQRKVNVIGSITSLQGKELIEVPASTVSNSLAGKLAGVVVMNRSGEPGNDTTDINIRGFGKPLVIVDGVEADFNRLDPNDIESISVLKDASAAIYGSRAGNGVILITTKRGDATKTRVQLSTSYGYQGSTVYPKYVNAAQYMQLTNEYNPGSFSEEEIAAYLNGSKKSTDWYGATFRSMAPILKTNLNISGGTDKAQYFLSYGYLDQQSILKSGDTRYNQHNIRSNINVDISRDLELQLDLAYRNELRAYPNAGMQEIMTHVTFARPTFIAEYPDASKPSHNGYSLIGPNYLSRRDVTGYRDIDYRNSNVNFALKYKAPFLRGLSAKAFVNYNTDDNREKNWKRDYDYYDYAPASDTYTRRTGVTTAQISLNEYFWRNNKTTAQFSANYEGKFGDHGVQALLLNEVIATGGFNNHAGRQSYTNASIDQLFASSADKQFTGGTQWQDARISYVGRFNYNFKEKYLLEYTFRYDASTRFHKDYRWGFFPSISAGWRLSEEDFIKNVGFIDNFKLRLSYGESGYDDYPEMYYKYIDAYRFGPAQLVDGKAIPTIESAGLTNKMAVWENMTIYNAGLDISLWNRLLWSEIDVFYRKREGMLAQRKLSIPSTFGAELPFENINSQNSRGFEVVLGHDNKVNNNTRYWITGNVSYARAKWDHFDEAQFADEDNRLRYQQSGQWVNRFFGYQALGIFTTQDEIDAYWVDQDGDPLNGINHNIRIGDIKYFDLNGDSLINELDQHAIGKNNLPEIFFGITAGISWKSFDFSMLWQGATGFNVIFTSEAQQPFYNNATPLDIFMDRWTPQNNDPNARFPRTVGSSGNTNNYRPSTFWLQDASYLRLKNATIGYTIPKSKASRVYMESIRFYISGQNLFTFTNVYPFDPETPDQARGWNYPQQRTIMLGAVVNF